MLATAAAIMLSAAAAYLLLALLDYRVADTDTVRAGMSAPVHNRAGPLGAWLAEWAFWLFGYGAYVFSALVLWPVLARSIAAAGHMAVVAALRMFGFALLLGSASALLALSMETAEAMPNGAGGWLGAVLVEKVWSVLGGFGAWLAWLALALAGLTLYAVISWWRVAEWSATGLRRSAAFCATALVATGRALAALSAAMQRARAAWQRGAARRAERNAAALDADADAGAGAKRDARRRASASPRIEPTLDDSELERMPVIAAAGEDLPLARHAARRRAAKASAKASTKASAQSAPAIRPVPPKAPAVAASRRASLRPAPARAGATRMPSTGLLAAGQPIAPADGTAMRAQAAEIETLLRDYGIKASVSDVLVGPMITLFELQPEAGVKASRISALARDLARALAVPSVRVVEVVPGKSVVGLEVPNRETRPVALREVLETDAYHRADSPLALALGQDIAGAPVVADLAEMPHLLVAGTTGAGKSVALNTMLLSMLCKAGPDQLRLVLVDPKMLELSLYEGIPHLLAPVVTDMRRATQALRWCVAEMERRYTLMAQWGVRGVGAYNAAIAQRPAADAEPPPERLPSIVVVIDEFADMIMVVGKRAEEAIIRVAQKARAAGMHLVLATQRPSVNVITGLIKANIPARIALKVPSRIDSRTVLDQGGAEQLLGHGDMLFLRPGHHLPMRLQGAFVSDQEVQRVVADWKRRFAADYLPALLEETQASGEGGTDGSAPDDGPDADLYAQAVAVVTERRQVSISSLQRRFRIGYNRAARMVDRMQEEGLVSEMNEKGGRTVLGPKP